MAYLPPAQKTEPWEPNVTALLDPGNLKWKDLIAVGTPIPTPWNKNEFDEFERKDLNQGATIEAVARKLKI